MIDLRIRTIVLLSLLAGCVPNNFQIDNPLTVFAKPKDRDNAAAAAQVAHLARSDAPVIIATIEERNASGALVLLQRNGDLTTWLSSDNTTFSFRGGLVVATRGLGGDLMSADISPSLAHIQDGTGGNAIRVHRYLDGEDQIRVQRFDCQISTRGGRRIEIDNKEFATRLVQESCKGKTQAFQNLYWLDIGTHGVLQSRQWISGETGAIALRQVLR